MSRETHAEMAACLERVSASLLELIQVVAALDRELRPSLDHGDQTLTDVVNALNMRVTALEEGAIGPLSGDG